MFDSDQFTVLNFVLFLVVSICMAGGGTTMP